MAWQILGELPPEQRGSSERQFSIAAAILVPDEADECMVCGAGDRADRRVNLALLVLIGLFALAGLLGRAFS